MLTEWFHHLSAHVSCEEGWPRFAGLEASLGPLMTITYVNQHYVRFDSPVQPNISRLSFVERK